MSDLMIDSKHIYLNCLRRFGNRQLSDRVLWAVFGCVLLIGVAVLRVYGNLEWGELTVIALLTTLAILQSVLDARMRELLAPVFLMILVGILAASGLIGWLVFLALALLALLAPLRRVLPAAMLRFVSPALFAIAFGVIAISGQFSRPLLVAFGLAFVLAALWEVHSLQRRGAVGSTQGHI